MTELHSCPPCRWRDELMADRARADALEAALQRLVLAIDAVGADDSRHDETLDEWYEAKEAARALLEKPHG